MPARRLFNGAQLSASVPSRAVDLLNYFVSGLWHNLLKRTASHNVSQL